MVRQLISAGLLAGTLVTAQMPSARLDVEGWLALHPDTDIHGITLWPDRAEAMVDGTLVTLDHAPFVEGKVFYLPIEEIAQLHGDTVSVEGDAIILEHDEGPFTMYVGQARVTSPDGTEYPVEVCKWFTNVTDYGPATEETTPQIRDGVAYIPAGFAQWRYGAPAYLCNNFLWAQDGFVILETSQYEETLDGFTLMEKFDELPAAQRAKVQEMGSLGLTRDYYDEVEYRGDGYAIHVARLRPGEEDGWVLDGTIVAIVIDGTQCATARGLRVGDTPQRAWELYGYMSHFGYETVHGHITRIGFSSYYTQHGIPSFWV